MSMTFFPAVNNGKPASVMGISRQLVFYVPVMMTLPRFLKRKTGLSLGVVFFWGIYFFLSPFLHFHPDDVHAHGGDAVVASAMASSLCP